MARPGSVSGKSTSRSRSRSGQSDVGENRGAVGAGKGQRRGDRRIGVRTEAPKAPIRTAQRTGFTADK